jgi:hypothetical protein
MLLQNRIHFFGHELVHLFRRTTTEFARVDHLVQLAVDGCKQWIVFDALHQIIRFTFAFDDRTSVHGVHTNNFVQFLAIAASLDTYVSRETKATFQDETSLIPYEKVTHSHCILGLTFHHDVFRGHKRQLRHNVRFDYFGPHVQTVADVFQQTQNNVGSQESFR